MTQRVVHAFEVVDIETKDRQLFVTCALQGLIQTIMEELPIWQIGQGIVLRQVRNPGFGPQPFGDVFVGRNPTPTRDRTIDDGDGPTIG